MDGVCHGRAREHAGEGIGGLLNATFGNAAELIIAVVALNGGLNDVVKAFLAGSIIGNILLVLGASMLAGGIRLNMQTCNPVVARSQTTMLTLAAIALMTLALFRQLVGPVDVTLDINVSLAIACVLLVAYPLNLFFTSSRIKNCSLESGAVTRIRPGDGVSDWLKGAQLLAIYVIPGILYFYAPIPASLPGSG